jgi:thiamine biosynthesis protein ThiS
MRIKVNGENKETDQTTVAGLLKELGIKDGMVAVEVNEKIIKKAALGETPLNEADDVEIVNFVGGG